MEYLRQNKMLTNEEKMKELQRKEKKSIKKIL